MRSGNRRRTHPNCSALAALAALFAGGLAVSCSPGARFDRSLARLDSALAIPGSFDFSAAPSEAREPVDPVKTEKLLRASAGRVESLEDWLRLLSRASLASKWTGNPDIAARLADSARKAYPTYEDIALFACRAYIDADRASDALALFPKPLDPRLRGTWFAEAFIKACAGSGRKTFGSEDVETLRLLSEHTGRGEPVIDAALLRMGAGDPSGAGSFLRYAKSLGAAVDPDLAWDVGVLDMLLSDPNRDTEAHSLLRKAESALLLGEREWAGEYLLALVQAFPEYSWKPYAALASLEGDTARADYWYEKIGEIFPADASAIRARASHLARTGRASYAVKELSSPAADITGDSRSAVLAAEIRLRLRPTEPPYALALQVSNAFPDDPYAQKWALGRLASSERYPEAAQVYEQLKNRGMDLGSPWYFEALPLILKGDLQAAIEAVEREGPSEGGPEAAFALGVLYARVGNFQDSAERFRIAASEESDPEGKARSLVEMGKSLAAGGSMKQAREAWASALSVCPDSAEALRLYASRQ